MYELKSRLDNLNGNLWFELEFDGQIMQLTFKSWT